MLLAADGVANTRIGADLGVSPTTVSNWRERFATDGLKGIGVVRQGRGRKPSIPPEKVQAIVHATLHEKPPGETHWSCRTMAEAQGVSAATVQRIWSARELKPHRVRTFKLSNDKPRRRVRGGAGKGSTVELDPSAPLLGGQTGSTTSLLSSEAQN